MPVPRNNDVGINLKANAQGLDLAIAKLRELNALLQSAGHGPASWMPGPLFGVPPTQAVKGLMAGQFRPSQYGAIGGAQLEQLTKQVGGWAQEAAISYGLLQAQVVEPAIAPRQQAATAAGAPPLPPPFYGGYVQAHTIPQGASTLPPPASPGMLALPGYGQSSYSQMRYGYNPAMHPLWVESGIPGRGGGAGPPALPPRTVSSAGGRPSDGDARTVLARIQEEEDAKKAVSDTKGKGQFGNRMLYGMLFQAFFGILFGGLQDYVQTIQTGQRPTGGSYGMMMLPAGLNLLGMAAGLAMGNPMLALGLGMSGQLGGEMVKGQAEGFVSYRQSVRALNTLYATGNITTKNWEDRLSAIAEEGGLPSRGLFGLAPNYGAFKRITEIKGALAPGIIARGGREEDTDAYAAALLKTYGDQAGDASGRVNKYLLDSKMGPIFAPTPGGKVRFTVGDSIAAYVSGGMQGYQDYLAVTNRNFQTEWRNIAPIFNAQQRMQQLTPWAGVYQSNLEIAKGIGPQSYQAATGQMLQYFREQMSAKSTEYTTLANAGSTPGVRIAMNQIAAEMAQMRNQMYLLRTSNLDSPGDPSLGFQIDALSQARYAAERLPPDILSGRRGFAAGGDMVSGRELVELLNPLGSKGFGVAFGDMWGRKGEMNMGRISRVQALLYIQKIQQIRSEYQADQSQVEQGSEDWHKIGLKGEQKAWPWRQALIDTLASMSTGYMGRMISESHGAPPGVARIMSQFSYMRTGIAFENEFGFTNRAYGGRRGGWLDPILEGSLQGGSPAASGNVIAAGAGHAPGVQVTMNINVAPGVDKHRVDMAVNEFKTEIEPRLAKLGDSVVGNAA